MDIMRLEGSPGDIADPRAKWSVNDARYDEPPNTALQLTDQASCVRGVAAHLRRLPAAEYHVREMGAAPLWSASRPSTRGIESRRGATGSATDRFRYGASHLTDSTTRARFFDRSTLLP